MHTRDTSHADNRVTAGLHTGRWLGAHQRGRYGQDRPTRCRKRPRDWRGFAGDSDRNQNLSKKLRRILCPTGQGIAQPVAVGSMRQDSTGSDGTTDATAAAKTGHPRKGGIQHSLGSDNSIDDFTSI